MNEPSQGREAETGRGKALLLLSVTAARPSAEDRRPLGPQDRPKELAGSSLEGRVVLTSLAASSEVDLIKAYFLLAENHRNLT